jgi:uncharacterized delta-60 repeat protein
MSYLRRSVGIVDRLDEIFPMPRITLVLVVAASLATASPALAAAGDLDPSYGDRGTVITFPNGSIAYGTTLDGHGRLIVVGSTFDANGIDVAVARFRRGGALDQTFGGNGRVRLDLGGQDFAFDVEVTSDGRIVVAGRRSTPTRDRVFALRLRPRGRLDPNFGNGGVVLLDMGKRFQGANAVALTGSDRIVLAGWVSGGATSRTAVARLLRTGRPDASFRDRGWTTFAFSDGDEQANDVLVLRSGRVVLAGQAEMGNASRFLLARLTSGGRLDRGFGRRGGFTLVEAGKGADAANALARGPGGTLTVAGRTADGGAGQWAVARFGPRGRLDATFGNGGTLILRFTEAAEEAHDLLVLPNGRSVLTGRIRNAKGNLDMGLVRLRPDGRRDRSFGRNGVVRIDVFGGTDTARAIVRQADGRFVVAGEAWRGGSPRFTAARVLPS